MVGVILLRIFFFEDVFGASLLRIVFFEGAFGSILLRMFFFKAVVGEVCFGCFISMPWSVWFCCGFVLFDVVVGVILFRTCFFEVEVCLDLRGFCFLFDDVACATSRSKHLGPRANWATNRPRNPPNRLKWLGNSQKGAPVQRHSFSATFQTLTMLWIAPRGLFRVRRTPHRQSQPPTTTRFSSRQPPPPPPAPRFWKSSG